jgi:hypothetical protein
MKWRVHLRIPFIVRAGKAWRGTRIGRDAMTDRGKRPEGDFAQRAGRDVRALTHDPEEERDRAELGLDLRQPDETGRALQRSYEAAQRASRDPEVMARAWGKIAEKRRSAKEA